MNLTIENILLVGSALLLISIIAGKTSYRFGVPVLVLFLTIGMLAGSEGIGGIYFDNPAVAQFIGIVSLNFILFSGGLDTSWTSTRPVLWQGITLSTLGVMGTALIIGCFVWLVTDFTIYEGLLLGAIVSSTDAAAVFSILRSKSLALKSNLRSLLELESGSNDPMAYVLTIAFLGLIMYPEKSVLSVIPLFLQQMLIGGFAGYGFGRISKFLINKIRLDFEGLYPVLVIALMFITFSLTNALGGNGFLAIYLCAVYLGNSEFIHKKTILRMFDGLAWLVQIVLFLTLGLLVFPSHIVPVIGIGLIISAFLILVARPLSVFLSLLPFRMSLRKKTYISWVGLRGAVPIVFATYPLLAGIEKAEMIFNLVFFISLTSVLVQGTTLPRVAKWLHVLLPERVKQRTVIDRILTPSSKTIKQDILIPAGSYPAGKKLVDLHIPATTIIALILRNGRWITPEGATTIEDNDILTVLTNDQNGIVELIEKLGITPKESVIEETDETDEQA